MKCIKFQNQRIEFIDQPIPVPEEDEVLIRVLMAGICNTDVELYRGYYDFAGVPGHEFVGVIEKAPQRPEWQGKRAVADINCGCGTCSWCLKGNHRHCVSRKTVGIKGMDGAFAQYVKVPLKNIYLVDDIVATEAAVFAEPLAAALEISQQIHMTSDLKVLVLGDGKLGLLIALALKHYNPDLLLVGKHESKLEIAKSQGINTIQVSSDIKLPHHFDIVIEATGQADGVNDALQFVRPEGTIVLKTTSHELSQINLAKVVVDEIHLVGSRCGDIRLALSFLRNGLVDVRPLIEGVYPFREFKEAFKHALQPNAKKVLLKLSD